jgi:hypothetical protein
MSVHWGEAGTRLDRSEQPILTDTVEKVGVTLKSRNNRISQAEFLYRSCVFDARFESILR